MFPAEGSDKCVLDKDRDVATGLFGQNTHHDTVWRAMGDNKKEKSMK